MELLDSRSWMFLILFYIYIYLTQGQCSHQTEQIFLQVPQAFARPSTMASLGVRENVYLNTNFELCWKILFFMN